MDGAVPRTRPMRSPRGLSGCRLMLSRGPAGNGDVANAPYRTYRLLLPLLGQRDTFMALIRTRHCSLTPYFLGRGLKLYVPFQVHGDPLGASHTTTTRASNPASSPVPSENSEARRFGLLLSQRLGRWSKDRRIATIRKGLPEPRAAPEGGQYGWGSGATLSPRGERVNAGIPPHCDCGHVQENSAPNQLAAEARQQVR